MSDEKKTELVPQIEAEEKPVEPPKKRKTSFLRDPYVKIE